MSRHAEYVINKYTYTKKSKSKPIIYVTEDLSHDGYGSESNLWDLYLYTENKKTDEIIILIIIGKIGFITSVNHTE